MSHNRYLSTSQPRQKWPVTLDFEREELLYDIKNLAYMEGEVMQDESGERKHHVQDIAEDGNIDRVIRMLDVARAECDELLYPYSKHRIEPLTWQNDEPRPGKMSVYTIEMFMPYNYSITTVTLLKHHIHEYMVAKVLGDWLSITNPAAAAKWKEKEEVMKTEILSLINMRTTRVRRTQTPL